MNPRAIVSLTFDDGLRCQFERAVPILDRHGFPGTFFLVANTDPVHTDGFPHPDWHKTTWTGEDNELFKRMVRQGHEIGAHSVSHRRPELDEDPKGEAEKSKRWIEERLEVEITSYCYPFYHLTDAIKSAVIGAGYKQARWGTNDTYYPLQDQIDSFQIDCRQISKYSFETVDGHPVGKDNGENVNDWLRPGCWHVLTYHGIGTLQDGWWAISVAEFARQMAGLARHRDSGAVEVITFNDGARRTRQQALS